MNPLTTPATATDPNAKLAMPAHGDLPAYISSTDFASALLDVLPNAPKDFAAVQASVETITDLQLKQLLQGMLARAENDLNTLRKHIADWFDNAMDRLSGGYKRQTQLVTFLLGLFAAGLLNINAIFVLEKLWERPSLAAALSSPDSVKMIAAVAKSPLVAASASSSAAAAADSGKSLDDWSAALGKLPVGWTNGPQIPGAADANTALGVLWLWLVLVGGWFVTATAAVFGAPFWFDLLQKLIQVRGTGTKPAAARDKS